MQHEKISKQISLLSSQIIIFKKKHSIYKLISWSGEEVNISLI